MDVNAYNLVMLNIFRRMGGLYLARSDLFMLHKSI
jgi:hypothetical protein